MTKQSLIDYVAEKAEMSKAEAGRALDAVQMCIRDSSNTIFTCYNCCTKCN